MPITSFFKNITLAAICLYSFGCSQNQGTSEAENNVIHSSAFGGMSFSVHNEVGDVSSAVDASPASRPFHVSSISESIAVPVRDCTTPGLYEIEKRMAVEKAAADTTGMTIPVKFSYSFGKKHDVIAKYANERAVLSATNTGTSYIPVGGKTSSRHNGKHFYYEADNTEVAREYKTGEKCFFSTITIKDPAGHPSSGKYDFISVSEADIPPMANSLRSKKTTAAKLSYLKHMIHYMYYGYCAVGRCAQGQAFAGEYANRLFSEIPSRLSSGEPQIIKLYMADLRSEQMEHDIVKLSEDTTRGLEIDSSIKNILNICEIHKNYYDVSKNLSLPKEVNGYNFNPIQGSIQLLHNILSHDVDGTMLSSQYTPIVLDLDGNGVKTSSTRWGTYFNMANIKDSNDNNIAHRTAWLGGDFKDFNHGANYDPRVQMDVRLTSGDGFLVLPDQNGKVTSSAQMFGDNLTVNGQTYDNGFLALQALAGKDCSVSQDVKSRYVGPWDGDIYENRLKVWVDYNRNGVSDEGEINSLRHHKIAAINACNINHRDEFDSFGNGTRLRSAMLLEGIQPGLIDRPSEIINHLEYGHGSDGEPSDFRLAIDLIFKVQEDNRCEGGVQGNSDDTIDNGETDEPLPDDEEEEEVNLDDFL